MGTAQQTHKYMNANQIVGGLMTGKLNLSIGCKQSVKLDDVALKATTDAGATSGSISASAKLWKGSAKVTQLQQKFVQVNNGFKAITLPWSEGVRIFRADRIQQVFDMVNLLIDQTTPLIDDIVLNYETELEAAYIALGKEGRKSNYPETGEDFRSKVVRKFSVDTLGTSNKLMEMVGGALGNQLAREHEDQLRQSIGQAQTDVAERMTKILERFMVVCEPGKEHTRVTEALFRDLNDLTTNLSSLLLFPNPQLENLNMQIRDTLGRLTRDEVAESDSTKSMAYAQASQLLKTLSGIPIV